MKDQIRERWRRRRLGSDRRAGSWAAGEARRRQLRLLRQFWWFFAVFLFLGGVLIAGVALTLDSDFLRGFVIGAGSIAVLGGTAVMVLMLSGTAATAMGATAEQWTASELRPLRKRGWFIVNHFLLRRHDIDHVLVGPNGVVAVETKWSGTGWQISPPSTYVTDAIRQLKKNAHDLELWHPVRKNRAPQVQAVLFLWTAGEIDLSDRGSPVDLDGVTVITNVKAAKRWRESLEELAVRLTPEDVRAIQKDLEIQTSKRDELEATEQPAPPSYSSMFWNGVGVFFSTTASLWTTAWLAHTSAWIFVGAQAAALLAGFAARRISPLRIPALGWIAVAMLGTAAAIVTAADAAINS